MPAPSPTVLRVGNPTDPKPREALEFAGTTVVECAGPCGSTCPMVEGRGCSLVDDAAGIVFELNLDDPYNRQILQGYRNRPAPQTPIEVVATPDQQERHRDHLTGVRTVTKLTDSNVNDFAQRVALADMARQALSDLVNAQPRPSRSRSASNSLSIEWAT